MSPGDKTRRTAAGLVVSLALACTGTSSSSGGGSAPGTPVMLGDGWLTASSVPPGDPHCAAGGVQLAYDGGVAYACNGTPGTPGAVVTSGASGAQGATVAQGTAGTQGSAGAGGAEAPSGPGALLWKDADGRTVPRVHDLSQGRFFMDEQGVLWQLDARRARISAEPYSPFVMAARASEYPSDDCSGDPYVSLDDTQPRLAYDTTGDGDGSPYAALPDDYRSLPSFGAVTIRSAVGVTCDEGGCSPVCDTAATMSARFPYALRGARAADLLALPTFPRPSFDFVAPLHPEVTAGAATSSRIVRASALVARGSVW